MLGNESSMLILMLSMKVPGNESYTYGTFVPGNESSRVRKFQLPSTTYINLLLNLRWCTNFFLQSETVLMLQYLF